MNARSASSGALLRPTGDHDPAPGWELLDAMPDAVIATDASDQIRYLNSAAQALLAIGGTDFAGRPADELLTVLDTDSDQSLVALLAQCRRRGERVHQQGYAVGAGNGSRPTAVDLCISPLPGGRGPADGALMVLREGRPRPPLHGVSAGNVVSICAPVDRGELDRRLGRAQRSASPAEPHALLVIELERMDAVLQSCGEPACDAVRQRAAAQIQSTVRQRDTLARLGPVRFALLMERCPLSRARERARQIRNAVGGRPLRWRSLTLRLDVSVGVVPIARANGVVAELLAAAALACQDARDGAGHGICVFEQADVVSHLRDAREREWQEHIQEVLF